MSTEQATGGSAVRARPARAQFHRLTVLRVVPETPDARSLVLAVPPALREIFAYQPGQFVTLRTEVGGETQLRSYSMSSCPVVDADLTVTVKRVPGGAVSGWLHDNVEQGATLDVNPPGGSFLLTPGSGDITALAAGSGITPVLSLVKAVLHSTDRRARLLYANRDRASTIFAAELDALAARFSDRLVLAHHLDVDRGFATVDTLGSFLGPWTDDDVYICGPDGFMGAAEAAAQRSGRLSRQVHIERFTPASEADPPVAAGGRDASEFDVTVRVGRRSETVARRPGESILRAARRAGLSAPSSCESGNCATCMARLVSGSVDMRFNDALTQDEVDEGWILTCQSLPISAVEVVYE